MTQYKLLKKDVNNGECVSGNCHFHCLPILDTKYSYRSKALSLTLQFNL